MAPTTVTKPSVLRPLPPRQPVRPRLPGHGRVDVIAHRGASGHAPENTLSAVRLAHVEGATAVECDVHRTRDGVLVVHHDATLGRCTDAPVRLPDAAPWRIADLTWEQVRGLDAVSWFGHGLSGERLASLEEWVGAVGPRAGMLVEVKEPSSYPGIEHDLEGALRALPAARATHAAGRLTVQSFDHAWLRSFKQLAPDVPVGALTSGRPGREELLDLASWAEQVNPRARVLTRVMVERAHDFGLRVNTWTVNDPQRMRRLLEWGVDGIITNHPARLVGLLEAVAH